MAARVRSLYFYTGHDAWRADIGPTSINWPGRAARRAEVAAQAWPVLSARAGPGTPAAGRAVLGPSKKKRASCRAIGPRAFRTSISVTKKFLTYGIHKILKLLLQMIH